MASPHALLETQALKQMAQIVKTDGHIGGAAEKQSQRLLSSHSHILRPNFRLGSLAIQPLLLPRLALARQALGQEDLEQRLVRNVAPIRQYFEILNHGDREAQ